MDENTKLICVVDDDESVTRALGRMVRSFGFDVRLLASSRECLDSPYVDRAACLIVDVTMPEIDGFELHALLQASGRNIPTIFISAHNNQENFDRARAAGAQAFLGKPFDTDVLHDAIVDAIAA